MSSLKRALHAARLWPVALVVSLSLCLGLLGCGKQPLSGSFAGPVAHSEALIALVTSDHKLIVYACDGQTLAQWFSGSLSGSDTLDVTNQGGARLQARLSATQAPSKNDLPAACATPINLAGEAPGVCGPGVRPLPGAGAEVEPAPCLGARWSSSRRCCWTFRP
jgi:hypothetical protein